MNSDDTQRIDFRSLYQPQPWTPIRPGPLPNGRDEDETQRIPQRKGEQQ